MSADSATIDRKAPETTPSRPQARDMVAQHRQTSEMLSLDQVSLTFGGVAALSDVSFSVRAGEIYAIIGPNGAGKSSALNVICGVYTPDRGQVRIGDQNHRRVPTARLARLGVARTFQSLALFKGLSVVDTVILGRSAHARASFVEQIAGLPRARREASDARDRAAATLAFLDLSAYAARPATTLAYGLQKRVELARALVAEPRLLLLDEPMAGMTAGEKQEMAGFITAARERFGTTVVLIEHDIGIVMSISDRICVLDYGRKIADGLPSVVRRDQAVIDAYLGVAHEEAA